MSLVGLREPSLNRENFFTQNYDVKNFEINVNAILFKPEEISIKVDEKNVLIIEGKHEKKENEEGVVSRYSVRRILLPEGLDLGQIRAKLYPTGTLIITMPKVGTGVRNDEVKIIPVQRVKSKL